MKNLFFLVSIFAANLASAQLVDWVDWTSGTTGVNGSASGVFGSGITVRYTGDVTFLQDGINGDTTDFWTEGTPAPYTGNAVIGNAPTPAEMVALSNSGIINTITFSEAILNPVMTLVSVGQSNVGVDYAFNQSFNFLSEGEGYWGDGSYSISGNTLTGNEFHGAIQFTGLITQISWTNSPDEYWHGFTVGAVVPEPSTIGLVMAPLGIGLILFIRRKRRK